MRRLESRSAGRGGAFGLGLALFVPVLLSAVLAGTVEAKTRALAGSGSYARGAERAATSYQTGSHVGHAGRRTALYQYGNGGATGGVPQYGGGSRREVMGGPGRGPRRALLRDSNTTLYGGPRRDVVAGIARRRVLRVMRFASRRHQITVSAIKTGHPYGSQTTLRRLGYGGYPNSHYFGRAVDIAAVDGVPVSPKNLVAKRLARKIMARFQPQELGSPWNLKGPGAFTNADHKDHIHIGWAYGR